MKPKKLKADLSADEQVQRLLSIYYVPPNSCFPVNQEAFATAIKSAYIAGFNAATEDERSEERKALEAWLDRKGAPFVLDELADAFYERSLFCEEKGDEAGRQKWQEAIDLVLKAAVLWTPAD